MNKNRVGRWVGVTVVSLLVWTAGAGAANIVIGTTGSNNSGKLLAFDSETGTHRVLVSGVNVWGVAADAQGRIRLRGGSRAGQFDPAGPGRAVPA